MAGSAEAQAVEKEVPSLPDLAERGRQRENLVVQPPRGCHAATETLENVQRGNEKVQAAGREPSSLQRMQKQPVSAETQEVKIPCSSEKEGEDQRKEVRVEKRERKRV